jgi:hypothetical protein
VYELALEIVDRPYSPMLLCRCSMHGMFVISRKLLALVNEHHYDDDDLVWIMKTQVFWWSKRASWVLDWPQPLLLLIQRWLSSAIVSSRPTIEPTSQPNMLARTIPCDSPYPPSIPAKIYEPATTNSMQS